MAATSAARHLSGGCVTFNTAGLTDGIVTRDGPISGCWPGTSLTRSRSFRWQDKGKGHYPVTCTTVGRYTWSGCLPPPYRPPNDRASSRAGPTGLRPPAETSIEAAPPGVRRGILDRDRVGRADRQVGIPAPAPEVVSSAPFQPRN